VNLNLLLPNRCNSRDRMREVAHTPGTQAEY
jgi:hypothetical protein